MASKTKKKPAAKKKVAPKKAVKSKPQKAGKPAAKAKVKKVVKAVKKAKPAAKGKSVVKAKAKPVAKSKAKTKAQPAAKSKSKVVVKPKAAVKKVVSKKNVAKGKVAVKSKVNNKVAKHKEEVHKVKPVAAKQVKSKKDEKPSTSVIKHVEKASERPSRRRSVTPFVKPPMPARTTPLREDPVLPDTPVASILKKPIAILENRPANLENSPDKTRYSDEELQEFRDLIIQKITSAKTELNNLQAFLNNSNEHGTDDTASSFKMLEDGSDTLAKEEAGQLAVRQRKFIEQLENALVRIENKTYGICRVTGKLIPKERLRAVPHTTQSIEAKVNQYRD